GESRGRPHRHRRAGGRNGPRRLRGGARVRGRADELRQDSHRAPGRQFPARRHGEGDRGGEAARLARGRAARCAPSVPQGGVDGETLRLRDGRARVLRRDPGAWRLRLRRRLPRRTDLPRRARVPDLRGHERNPAARHRPRARLLIRKLPRFRSMAAAIDFYFDFSSPYGFLAAQKIEALAQKHGRTVDWHPVLLGAIFKETGATPLPMVPLKGEYSKRDITRSARFHGVDFRMPSKFPIATIAAARVVLWLKGRDPALAVRVAKALYRAYFLSDVDISDPEQTITVAANEGVNAAE